MGAKKESIAEFEVRIKDFIKQERHEEARRISNVTSATDEKVDKLILDSALTNQSFMEIQKDIRELKDMLVEHMRHEEKQIEWLREYMEQKFASKWVEKIAVWVITAILVTVWGYAGNAILYQIKNDKQVVAVNK